MSRRRCIHLLSVLGVALWTALSSPGELSAQRGPAANPIIKPNTTVKLADHTYVISDDNVGLVPNVGIVVGSRATLVIDPGLGRRNGETVLAEAGKVSRKAEVFIASTHFHAEHTTGYVAFPPAAKYINSTVQEADFEQGGIACALAKSAAKTRSREESSASAGSRFLHSTVVASRLRPFCTSLWSCRGGRLRASRQPIVRKTRRRRVTEGWVTGTQPEHTWRIAGASFFPASRGWRPHRELYGEVEETPVTLLA